MSATSWEWAQFIINHLFCRRNFHCWRNQWPTQLLWMPFRFHVFFLPHRHLHLLMPVTWVSPHSLPLISSKAQAAVFSACVHVQDSSLDFLGWPLLPCVLTGPGPSAVHLHRTGLMPITKLRCHVHTRNDLSAKIVYTDSQGSHYCFCGPRLGPIIGLHQCVYLQLTPTQLSTCMPPTIPQCQSPLPYTHPWGDCSKKKCAFK